MGSLTKSLLCFSVLGVTLSSAATTGEASNLEKELVAASRSLRLAQSRLAEFVRATENTALHSDAGAKKAYRAFYKKIDELSEASPELRDSVLRILDQNYLLSNKKGIATFLRGYNQAGVEIPPHLYSSAYTQLIKPENVSVHLIADNSKAAPYFQIRYFRGDSNLKRADSHVTVSLLGDDVIGSGGDGFNASVDRPPHIIRAIQLSVQGLKFPKYSKEELAHLVKSFKASATAMRLYAEVMKAEGWQKSIATQRQDELQSRIDRIQDELLVCEKILGRVGY